jgi:hypothetical protein
LPREVFFFGFGFVEPPAALAAAFFAVFFAGIGVSWVRASRGRYRAQLVPRAREYAPAP